MPTLWSKGFFLAFFVLFSRFRKEERIYTKKRVESRKNVGESEIDFSIGLKGSLTLALYPTVSII